jgi:glycosyltransferase involved in cell wall biosynthesis
MKILFLSCWYPTPEQPYKGIFIREHAAALKNHGHEVVVLALDVAYSTAFYKKSYERFTDEQGIDTHLLKVHSRFYKAIYVAIPLLNRYFASCYRKKISAYFHPEVVHSNVLNPCAIIGSKLSRKLRVPHVITEHWSKVARFMEKNVFAKAAKRAYAEAAAITCVSAFLEKSIQPFVKDKSRIHIVPNVVQSAVFTYAPKPEKNPVVFTAAASWRLPKRPELFISALEAIAAQTSSNFEVHLFGEGPQLNEFRAREKELPFRIYFRGYCGKDEVAAQLRKSHFFLHASDIETFSIVVAEALATGTPVIASNAGALPELVTGTCGVLCENTPAGWEKGISIALAASYDCAAISAVYNPKFSAPVIAGLFTSIYETAVKARANDIA